ncbi:MAG: HEAT repeat domain-containing protein [Gemmatimonadetes bacterium]|nr:HEAT repeat domain-containing protein [Gemmatimonadota bacterium]
MFRRPSPGVGLPLELVYAAALALLIEQLRAKAPMPDILASVGRLCALARVGSVTIAASALDVPDTDAAGAGAQLLRERMLAHGIEAMDIATSISDSEFMKLAGILAAEPSVVAGGIVETAEALSIFHVRLHAWGVALRPTPPGMRAVEVQAIVEQVTKRPRVEPVAAVSAPNVPNAPLDDQLAAAVARGDGLSVCRLLLSAGDDAQFMRLATPSALQLAVEQLMEGGVGYDDGLALLTRAGLAGAEATFSQLVAATEAADRRFLYDLCASLPTIAEVARRHMADDTWYVVRNAAGLLGETRTVSAIPELSRLLRHPDARVRQASVVALGQIGGPSALARLESVLFDPSVEVRNRALAIVFAAPDSDPLPDRVMLALEEENALETRLEMITALAHVVTPRARAKLESLAQSPSHSLDDVQVRLAAMGALAAGHGGAARATLTALLDDPSSMVRERAAALLGRR